MGFFWRYLLLGLPLCFESKAEPDPHITNGTCYYKAGEKLDKVFSPAGNAALGHTFCCELGDKLNSHSACVKEDIVYTYLAGCTDPKYENSNCPQKGNYSDYPWVGMVQCDGADAWVGCNNDRSDTVGESKESQGCTCELEGHDPDEILIEAAGLDAWGFLPDEQGKSIDWLPGFPLSTTPWLADTMRSTSFTASSTISLSPPTTRPFESTTSGTASSAPANSSTSPNPLTDTSSSASSTQTATSHSGIDAWSTAQKTGLGFGVALAGLTILALLALLAKKVRDRQVKLSAPTLPSYGDDKSPVEAEPTLPVIADPALRSPAWSGHKAELPGSPPPVSTDEAHELNHHESMTPSTWSSQVSPLSKHSSDNSAYRPYRYRPDANLDGIQELPDHERPRWAQTNFGTYGPNLGMQAQQEGGSAHAQHSLNHPEGQKEIHELPG